MHAHRFYPTGIATILLAAMLPTRGVTQNDAAEQMADATEVLSSFTTADDATAIPSDLLARARGIAVIPQLFRGGFIIGGRRGRGVLSIRTDDGEWSNPAFVTLTGGSIGWQFGGETTDLVLVFANENSVKNIATGKFTLGGDASAVAGPVGRQRTMAVTFRAEVYSYVRRRGLYAGAAFEGARLNIDEAAGVSFYPDGARPFDPVSAATPPSARAFLETLAGATDAATTPSAPPSTAPGADSARTFPLEE